METIYEIHAYAKNTTFNRTWSAVLTGDGKFEENWDALTFEKAPILRDYVNQNEANKFSAYTNVKFEVVEISTDLETEETNYKTIEEISFEVLNELAA